MNDLAMILGMPSQISQPSPQLSKANDLDLFSQLDSFDTEPPHQSHPYANHPFYQHHPETFSAKQTVQVQPPEQRGVESLGDSTASQRYQNYQEWKKMMP